MWVALHKCMEAMLGISLYSYLYLKLAKHCLSYYLLYFQQNQRTRGWNRFCLEPGWRSMRGRERWNKQCVHNVSKYKNDKKKRKKKHALQV
jgi:hypothetical protein